MRIKMKEKLNPKLEEAMKKHLYNAKVEKTPSTQKSLEEWNQKEVIERVKKSYSQAWSAYNSAKTREKIIAESLLLELLDFFEDPKHQIGRKPFKVKEKILCMFIYTYGGFSSRSVLVRHH